MTAARDPESVHWLFLDLNSYFASCEQQETPALRGKPVAVVPFIDDSTVCLAASYEAKAYGVKTGTNIREAKKLCRGIQFVEARHEVYVRYHHAVVEAVESCVPVAMVFSIDEVACKLTGSQCALPKALALAATIKQTVATRVGQYLKSSIGLAPNRYLAKVASDMQKPDGLTVLQKKNLPQALFVLKPRELYGIGPKMEAHLKRNGIHTVEKLCRLSQSEMRHLWNGIVGERYYQWLRGEEVDLPPTKTKSISHQHVLAPELRNGKDALAIAKRLLTKAALRLRNEGYYTRLLHVNVTFLGNLGDVHESRRVEETQDSLALLKALEALWKKLPEGRPFRVGVSFSNLIPEHLHQLSLFENPKREQLTKILDRINVKYGKDAVHLGAIHEHVDAAPTLIAFSRIPKIEEL